MTSDNSRHRLGLIAVTALSLFGALFARLWFLQVVEGETLSIQAEGNATQEVVIPAERGRILDRNGLALVDNRESIVVGIDAQEFGDLSKKRQAAVLDRLVRNLNPSLVPEEQLTVDSVRAKLNDSRYSRFSAIPIADDLTVDDEIYFSEQAHLYPAVDVERTTVRSYPYGSLAAHLLGYVGPLSDSQWEELEEDNDPDKPYQQTDEIGKAGVESYYEEYLRGVPGKRVYEVDRRGRLVREIESERREPKAGDDLFLAIDARVQYKTEEALAARLELGFEGRDGAEAGGMVVMDHTNGQVRAMASYPTYNPADLVGGISCPTWRDLQGLAPEGKCGDEMTEEIKQLKADGEAPVPKLLNRAIQGTYAPASTFKLASAYAATKLGIRTPEDTISDPGYYRLCEGDTTGCLKTNAGEEPHGAVNLAKSLTVSSDVYYYQVGEASWQRREQLGEDAMQKAVEELGYGAKTGIDLAAESPGVVPTPDSEAKLAASLFEADPEYYDNDPAKAEAAGRWNTGLSADFAIGQRVNATPLQTANAYAALANGGTLFQPTLMDKITASREPDQIRVGFAPEEIRKIDWGPALDDYQNGFKGVVDPAGQTFRGTAWSTFEGFPFESMPLGGKTGTAQTGEDEYGQERPDNSLFVAFTMGGETAWTATAMLEFSGSGANSAAPAVRMVLEPIATGEVYQFQLPEGGAIDAEAAAEESSAIGTTGSD